MYFRPAGFPAGLFLSSSSPSMRYHVAMKRLIVNADDLGAGAETDRGILKAFREGVVTSASLLANGPSFSSAAKTARLEALPVGVHLNLSEGVPLTGPLCGLTDRAGRFPGKYRLRQLLAGTPPDPEHLLRELTAQVERVFEAGLRPDHVDTHQHFFLFPSATPVVMEVARRFGIGALRLPFPAEPDGDSFPPLSQDICLYRRLAPAARVSLHRGQFACPDALYGMATLNRLNEDRLLQTLEIIPPGTWELMVHPGYPDPQNPFSGPERQLELEALVSSRVRHAIDALRIQLITFGDLS